ncbi:MAG TPA: type II toxin-antitoxin system prevent-host-death family antitoxin [Acetobacteraceae bacterium]|nr:type II toxin-antitoxin system prevent-host-death family antitoxin [Acetobacteraceae bacterium]
MATYSVAEAKNRLPALIDKAIEGEEVVITRHGKPVAELHPRHQPSVKPSKAARPMLEWLLARTRARKSVGITSVELLDEMYEDDET